MLSGAQKEELQAYSKGAANLDLQPRRSENLSPVQSSAVGANSDSIVS